MINTETCEWLINNADVPIRYRTARELLKDEKIAKKIEGNLLENPVVQLWLKNLKPESPPQKSGYGEMAHGHLDFCLNNALTQLVQLGLHGGIPQVADSVQYHSNSFIKNRIDNPSPIFRSTHDDIDFVITPNMLCMAGIENDIITRFLLRSLDEMYAFARQKDYDIYYSLDDERRESISIPKMWEDHEDIIKLGPLNDYGSCCCYPLIYDVMGLHQLYGIHGAETDEKINTVIEYISSDDFHNLMVGGYGILVLPSKVTKKRMFGLLAWSPQYPGWFDVAEYIRRSNDSSEVNYSHHGGKCYVPKLLFFAEHISNYPAARKTKWFSDLLCCLENYKTKNGTYEFPKEWLPNKQGFSVGGFHMSFGENRRKKNWLEIESTFFMQLLQKNV